MCSEGCKPEQLGNVTGKKMCGGVPDKARNIQCLEVDRRPFQDCLKETSQPAILRACDAQEPCRDDYACMRVDKAPLETGACMPPYFAFQVRVDGHMFDE